MIEYFTYPGVPGRYFFCDKYRTTISETSCANRYREAKKVSIASLSPLEKCVGCTDGAANAGDTAVQNKATAIGRHTCARCHQPAQRLVCGGICVSCSNREREVAKGCNAKGVSPHPIDRFMDDEIDAGKTLVMHSVELTVCISGRARVVSYKGVADTLEAVLRSMRGVRDEVSFSRRTPTVVRSQMSFWSGL